MQERFGDIWSMFGEPGHIVLITTNGVVNNGQLVMGRGIALEAVKRLHGIAETYGRIIYNAPMVGERPFMAHKYHLIILEKTGCGILQTKYHWRNPSPVELVRESLCLLEEYALENPDITLHTVWPGCGNGGLDRDQVRPFLQLLPDNVVVWSPK